MQIQSPKDSDAVNLGRTQESAFLTSALDDSKAIEWSVAHTLESSVTELSSLKALSCHLVSPEELY